MTEITEFDGDLDDEDLIAREDMVVTVSHKGYIKRVPLSTYRAQRRGGKGRSGMSTRDEDFVVKLFVANTHTPVLFFSSRGMAYKLKVWRLPVGTPTSLGKALINILPLQEGETITTIMPLPEDEATWADLNIMFATTAGTVRRNNLSDFTQINRNGKIAMKLDDDERDQIVGVEICTEDDDVMLTASNGNCIRFNVTDVRVFASRNSTGVRGVALADGATLIGMTILRHVAADAAERAAYLKQAAQMRRALIDDGDGVEVDDVADTVEAEEGSDAAFELPPERYAELSAKEQFLLTLSRNGYGKRSSAYEYRVTGRGGKGIVAMVVNDRNGPLVANFPVEDTDQIMLVTSGGQLIRCPVDGIRVAGRNTQGVTVFNTGGSSQVVSVEHIPDDGSDAGDDDDEAPDTAPQAE
ncbi:MAG: DNA gyrase C-terminal beta-propeller domain-containing protein, partial [Pseudomonadota bacterium]